MFRKPEKDALAGVSQEVVRVASMVRVDAIDRRNSRRYSDRHYFQEGVGSIEELNTSQPYRNSSPLSPGGESVREGFPE